MPRITGAFFYGSWAITRCVTGKINCGSVCVADTVTSHLSTYVEPASVKIFVRADVYI